MDFVSTPPLFTNDATVFGILMAVLTLIFKTTEMPSCKGFYKVVPSLLLCYFVPSLLHTFGVISPHWIDLDAALAHLRALGHDPSGVNGVAALKDFVADNHIPASELQPFTGKSQIYFAASRYLLPASLVLLTLSIDLKEILRLGPKALIMFGTATVGVILGGPLAILITNQIAPEVLHPENGEQIWRGMTTVAGSWIGGGANFIAIGESVGANDATISLMVVVDVAVANVWMAVLLWFAGREKEMDQAIGADRTAIDRLREKVETFEAEVARPTNLPDLLIMLAIAFGATAAASAAATVLPDIGSVVKGFTWVVLIVTTVGLVASFTPIRNLEGSGASRMGSVFLYLLVATIGAKAEFHRLMEAPALVAVGAVWMFTHAMLILAVRKKLKAPIFFAAVGSQANVGGAASAPIVASAFHPALAPAGVLLAVGGYVVGTYAGLLCAVLLELVHNNLFL